MSPVSWEMTVLKHQQPKLAGRLKVVFKGDLFHVSEGINYFADLRMTFRQNVFFKIGLETNLE
jgi:hypothetical protein